MSNLRHIAAHYLIDRGEVIQRPVITVDDEGEVVRVEQWECLDALPHTEFFAGALCAGMVNAHSHVELSYLRGAISSGTGFAGFARAIGQVRNNFTAEQRQRAMCAADAVMWQEGVAAVADIVNDSSSLEMKRRSRIHYHTMVEVFGLNSSIEPARDLAREFGADLTTHSTYSIQDGVFRQIADECRGPLSIHFMESDDEAALYRGEGSLAAWYERMGWTCDFLHYGSPAQRVIGSVARDKRVLLVHNCCVTEQEVQGLERHFDGNASWVLCPRSNDYISGLRPPVEMLQRAGARICIGTDSLASNSSLSMLDELKCFSDVPAREVLKWATINGAEALGLEQQLGSIERGKRPGVVLIDKVERRSEELYISADGVARRLV